MYKKLIVSGLVALFASVSPSLAKDMTGKFSLGFHNSNAPLGGRYWINQKAAIDLGVGFKSNEVVMEDPVTEEPTTENTMNFWLEAGVPIKVYDVDNAHFYARPAVLMGLLDDRDYGTGSADAKWTSIDVILSLGAELFFGEHFSVEATHGVKANFTTVPDEVKNAIGTDSLTSFETFGNNLTSIGFHFYF